MNILRYQRSGREHVGPAGVAGWRTGATLTEVLMGLLIMSIGVVSVFSLYPITVLRSIKATQSTNARVTFENALATTLGEGLAINGAAPWRPNVNYGVGDVVTAVPSDGQSIVDPVRYMCVFSDGNLDGTSDDGGVSGGAEPAWPTELGSTNTGLPPLPPGGSNAAIDNGQLAWIIAADPNPGDGAEWPGGVTLGTPYAGLSGGSLPTPIYGNVQSLESLSGGVHVVDPLGWLRLEQVRQTNAALGTAAGDAAALAARNLRDAYGSAPRLDAGYRLFVGRGPRLLDVFGAPRATALSAWGRFANTVADLNTPTHLTRVAEETFARRDTYEPFVDSFFPTGQAYTAAVAGTPTTPAGGTFSVPVELDLSPIVQTLAGLSAINQTQSVRLIITASNGRSITRWLTVGSITDNPVGTADSVTVSHLTDLDPDPTINPILELGGAEVEQLRIEVAQGLYSWLATVRNATGESVEGDVVIFFRRTQESNTESGFAAWFGNNPNSNDDDPFVGGAANTGFVPGTAIENLRRAWIAPGVDRGDGAGNPPDGDFLDAGDAVAAIIERGHLFNSATGEWYRVQSVISVGVADETDTAFGANWVVELDREVGTPTPQPAALAPPTLTPGPGTPQAVVPRGVVEVYPFSSGGRGDL